MNRLTVRIPENLHQTLVAQAKEEGVSLNQYIVYNLARVACTYTASPVSQEEQLKQRQQFDSYFATAKIATAEEVENFFNESSLLPSEDILETDLRVSVRKLLVEHPIHEVKF